MKDGIAQSLVVVDMQNDFVHEKGSLYVHKGKTMHREINDIVGNVCHLIEYGEPWDAVLCTLDTHFGNYFATLEGEKLPVRHCTYGMWGHELHDDVKAALDSTGHYRTIEKNTFGSLRLADEIREALDFEHDITLPYATRGGEMEIHICGVCTSICVLANAVLLRARYPDARIVVDSEACADVSIEAHEAALQALRCQQCEIV